VSRLIKRYGNRKLYDTQESRYVTLEVIASFVKQGEEVQVVDNDSGEDLTAVTFAQISSRSAAERPATAADPAQHHSARKRHCGKCRASTAAGGDRIDRRKRPASASSSSGGERRRKALLEDLASRSSKPCEADRRAREECRALHLSARHSKELSRIEKSIARLEGGSGAAREQNRS
jgi:hypothetical protein